MRLLLLFALLPACGGDVFNATDGGNDSATGDGGPGPDCPDAVPGAGSSCSSNGVACEYGGDPRWTCNTVTTCTNGAWTLAPPGTVGCPTTNGPACPPLKGEIMAGATCTPNGASCNYSTSSETYFCECMVPGGPPQLDGGGPTWQCTYGLPGCPAVRPRIGSSCSQPNLDCDYGVCGIPVGVGVHCEPTTNTWGEGYGSVCAGAQHP